WARNPWARNPWAWNGAACCWPGMDQEVEAREPGPTRVWDAVGGGAGQAGLSAAHHLRVRGVATLVLDANDRPGGAWQHRWDSLTMQDVHGVADLPGAPAPPRSTARANEVVPAYFADYEA